MHSFQILGFEKKDAGKENFNTIYTVMQASCLCMNIKFVAILLQSSSKTPFRRLRAQ